MTNIRTSTIGTLGSELAGKVALVTGVSRGIGAAVAEMLASLGATVALTYARASDRADEVADRIRARGGTALVVQADLTESTAGQQAVASTVREFGRIDILVNNASVLTFGPQAEVSASELDRVLAVDVRSVFLTSQAAARHMAHGGRIISIGSFFDGRVPGPNFVLQATAKAALIGLTKGLARELGPSGINVTIVDPRLIDTEMNPADGDSSDFQRSLTALGTYGAAEDIASAVAFLAGSGGRFVTGATLAVDGGYTA
jgi:3-oxoacyl-[acyl-carrier protein] reductase